MPLSLTQHPPTHPPTHQHTNTPTHRQEGERAALCSFRTRNTHKNPHNPPPTTHNPKHRHTDRRERAALIEAAGGVDPPQDPGLAAMAEEAGNEIKSLIEIMRDTQ
jgi:hypothetical protein